jgi:hypothetical protein
MDRNMDAPPDSFTVTPPTDTEPPRNATGQRDPRFSVMATAACTSAIVSVLTLWLWTPAPPPGDDSGGTVSVTYEPLDPERARDGRAGDGTDSRDPVADVVATSGDSAVVPVSGGARAASLDAATRISITTQPGGASVTINGVGYGTTPLTIPYLPPGAKRIRVTKAGYETEERFYSSDAARASSLRIALRAIPRGATR